MAIARQKGDQGKQHGSEHRDPALPVQSESHRSQPRPRSHSGKSARNGDPRNRWSRWPARPGAVDSTQRPLSLDDGGNGRVRRPGREAPRRARRQQPPANPATPRAFGPLGDGRTTPATSAPRKVAADIGHDHRNGSPVPEPGQEAGLAVFVDPAVIAARTLSAGRGRWPLSANDSCRCGETIGPQLLRAHRALRLDQQAPAAPGPCRTVCWTVGGLRDLELRGLVPGGLLMRAVTLSPAGADRATTAGEPTGQPPQRCAA